MVIKPVMAYKIEIGLGLNLLYLNIHVDKKNTKFGVLIYRFLSFCSQSLFLKKLPNSLYNFILLI